MLGSLGLGTGLVAGNEQQDRVHDGGAVQHGSHENVVARTVDKGQVTQQLEFAGAARALARELVLFAAACRAVAARPRTALVVALVYFGIGIAQFDGDVALSFVSEANSENAGQCFDQGGFAVGYVADGAHKIKEKKTVLTKVSRLCLIRFEDVLEFVSGLFIFENSIEILLFLFNANFGVFCDRRSVALTYM
ncbi:hypothetical protein BpHYR1_030778 [Brachionus plicatilis]|uniref:Uncharacterized protein n=1 Tax=Brachionus plicatilis TaxID=10195 RepID=A0A3M7RJG1_BRAPC|nr:hypothetical protein BpHYR1_030778 [Brachionus plicatilis]